MSGGHILIVDDDTANIRALASVLEDRHEVRFATSGRRALELASADPPELVLLDVMMPGLDGYAVCRLLKTDPATADVPVIFITSLSSPEEEAFGLETGAVDYVTKPFSPAIVRARVATHLSLRRANRSLKDENEHLEALVRERTRKLAQAQREKMAALRQMVAGVAHEINTPIGVALGSASHLGDRVAAMTERLTANQLRRAELERFLASAGELAALLSSTIARAGEIVRCFKGVAADHGGLRQTIALRPFLEQVTESLRPQWEPLGHRMAVDCPADLRMVSNPAILSAVLEQLVRNALEHAFPAGRHGLVTVGAAGSGPDTVLLSVADDGAGIAEGTAGRILEPFFTTRRGTGSVGLGLNIVDNLASDRLGGTFTIASRSGGGTLATLHLPVRTPPDL
ncbi:MULTISPECIES: sensor histidine kinase [Azospirillum]|uniref:histidine kinase n=1 Tax=Azospirillum brasilense TaxID=192 RepID=A0ABU4P5X7_AZOBR|nr:MULTISPECIES: hybrid sensor histidine kinase/response regulator [Azospirillum]MDW7554820.1 hybrid sensor histidine kinase/response regulator [Azospirillum brasilense]MDW7597159.1 hybrid sensor histidine kinase/response regulator [Azospirillum brasilense]MDW7632018.1 hybrid sensor histidine kinase/response regulator [Azospirillum brasilense]MDX5951939.1 hybrid sensor histidine kinase/response regulator [Azospirillum brasilense]TVZ61761.1 phospho-acceptor domain-containing protein [Azospirill